MTTIPDLGQAHKTSFGKSSFVCNKLSPRSGDWEKSKKQKAATNEPKNQTKSYKSMT